MVIKRTLAFNKRDKDNIIPISSLRGVVWDYVNSTSPNNVAGMTFFCEDNTRGRTFVRFTFLSDDQACFKSIMKNKRVQDAVQETYRRNEPNYPASFYWRC